METWNSVSKLSVIFETGQREYRTRSDDTTYEIGVVISIQPTGNNGEPVEVDIDTLYRNTSLIDYVNESPLPLKGSEKDREFYYRKPEEITPKGNRTPQIKYVVGHGKNSPNPRIKSIGIQVKAASGTFVYSSLNGTYHSSVQIMAP